MTRGFEDRTYMVPVLRKRPETEIARNAVQIPNLCLRFEEPSHDLSGFLFEIRVIAGISNNRHPSFHALQGFSDDVKVLTSLQRYVDSDGFGQVSSPHSRCHHHGFGIDDAMVLGFNADATVALL